VKYLLMLRTVPEAETPEDSPEFAAEMARWGAVHQEMEAAGVLVTGIGLESDDQATTLRVRDGERVLTDGPFAETKELLFSFYIIDVEDLDAALGWAAKMPCADYASVEIRPLSAPSQAA
jgi:hypothetical protein